jgi:hypothetical protein
MIYRANRAYMYVEHHVAFKNTVKKNTTGRISKSAVAMYERSRRIQRTSFGNAIEHANDYSRRGNGRGTSRSQQAVSKLIQSTQQTRSTFSSRHRKKTSRRQHLTLPKLQISFKDSTAIDRLWCSAIIWVVQLLIFYDSARKEQLS